MNFGTGRAYEGCRPLYPASGRLQSVPPRYYDVIDGESGEVIESDRMSRNRTRSTLRQMRQSEARDWKHPLHGDMVEGSSAHPGNYTPRTPSEYARNLLCITRSPSPAPQTINSMNRDMIDSAREKIHHSKYSLKYPETYRSGKCSTYSSDLGRCYQSHDSPGYRFYRYSSPAPKGYMSENNSNSRYSTRISERIFLPVQNPVAPKYVPLSNRRT